MKVLNTKDPFIMLSILNMKLRDEYDSLDALCEDYDQSVDEVLIRMDAIGYSYSMERNQFV